MTRTSAPTPDSRQGGGRRPTRWSRRAALGRLAATGAALALFPALGASPSHAEASARQAGCSSGPEPVSWRPVAPAALAADLPDPFTYRPDGTDRAAVLREVGQVVQQQAAELGVEACYLEKAAPIVQRIEFLSPYEFLVSCLYDQDPARRDALRDLYASDPPAAVRELAPLVGSPRTQMTLATYAYYNLDADRVLVNAAHVPAADLRRVLVHESWHAMPRLASWTDANGTSFRASGFWTQERRSGPRLWMPVEAKGDLPYEPYLLNEGMATMMETRFGGPSRFAQRDVEQVRRFFEHVLQLGDPGDVMRPYLESRPQDLVAVVEKYRASLPELQPIAHP